MVSAFVHVVCQLKYTHTSQRSILAGLVPGGRLRCEFVFAFLEKRQRSSFAKLLSSVLTTRLEFDNFLKSSERKFYFWLVHSCSLRASSKMKTQMMLMGLLLKNRGATRSAREVLAGFGILPPHSSFVRWRDTQVADKQDRSK